MYLQYTPMIRQYLEIKQNYQDAILFFRLGDFYEMFFTDAEIASKELEITLTARDGGGGNKVPMCGVPYHAAETYIARLIEKNYKVAICEQLEPPGASKGIVRREVTRVITPGTFLEGQFLDAKVYNYLVCVTHLQDIWGLAYADITTGHFMVTQFSGARAREALLDELTRLQPKEVLLPRDDLLEGIEERGFMISLTNPAACEPHKARKLIERQCGHAWHNSGIEKYPGALTAAGGLLAYLEETQKQRLAQIDSIGVYSTGQFMVLDAASRRNLEITASLYDGGRRGTLLSVLDHTCTAMGGRMLRTWLEQPLRNRTEINRRLDAVQAMVDNIFLRDALKKVLDPIYDLERLGGKASSGTASARDLVSLRQSLKLLPVLKKDLQGTGSQLLEELSQHMDSLDDIYILLDKSLVDDPPVTLREGGLIKEGYNEEIDRLRRARREGKKWLTELELRERQRTGIKSLKIRYNKVFGYYIEVTKANLKQVPPDYQRKQTLVNAERFITPVLKEYEELILNAEDRLVQLEYRLFCHVRDQVAQNTARIRSTASCVAEVDALLSLAEVAVKNNYTRPVLTEEKELIIEKGRHPVVEQALGTGEFVPNDTCMSQEDYISIITGPNMAGKSTYMRQVALIVLMAHVGSFVPAESAQIGIVDRIFTRVGAADDLAGGRSTFMVEMNECRAIVEYGTSRSLIIMDEVGRGTSTYDGISLARAMLEYIHDKIRARTLFSTHYHELTDMESLPGVKNYTILVEEQGEEIVFLRKLQPGKADRSYGIQVARLAGIPEEVLERARDVLSVLEVAHGCGKEKETATKTVNCSQCESCVGWANKHPVLQELRTINVEEITPLKALNTIASWQEILIGLEKGLTGRSNKARQ